MSRARARGGADDSEDEAEEHKQSLREEIERKYYPERYDFWVRAMTHLAAHPTAEVVNGAPWAWPFSPYLTSHTHLSHSLRAVQPFGDPFLHKRRLEATKAKQSGKRQWHEED